MKSYLSILDHVLRNGTDRSDRTGTGTRSVFGHQARFRMDETFPLLTTKKLHLRSIIHELLWFLNGDTNVKYLQENGVSIWDEWADEDGNLGRVYGAQWTDWKNSDGEKVNQIDKVIKSISQNPDGRRHIVCAWNPGELDRMALPPCHALFQFYVADGKLSCQLYQRCRPIFGGTIQYSFLRSFDHDGCQNLPTTTFTNSFILLAIFIFIQTTSIKLKNNYPVILAPDLS